MLWKLKTGVVGLAVFIVFFVFTSDKWLGDPGNLSVPYLSAMNRSQQDKENAVDQHNQRILPPDPDSGETDVDSLDVEKDESVAERLRKKVRVLIWVMTTPTSLDRALAVKNTWGRRCDKLLFFSSQENAELPAIKQNVSEGREHLTAKTMQAFDYIYKHYFHQADWFMKSDDDTYVLVENLRYFLADKDPNKPWITGRLLHEGKQNFESGGAGYVLSIEALRRLANRRKQPPECLEDGGKEDVHIMQCLQKLGVTLLSSDDQLGRTTFHAMAANGYVLNQLPLGYDAFDAHVKAGAQHISEFPITFHYIDPSQMHMMHFFIYHIQTFGITQRFGNRARQLRLNKTGNADLKQLGT